MKKALASQQDSSIQPNSYLLLFGFPPDASKQLSSLNALSSPQQNSSPEPDELKAVKRYALFLQPKTSDFQKIEHDLNITYFREIGSDSVRNVANARDSINNLKIIQLHKTHEAMIRFADTKDKDLQTVLGILKEIVVEIENLLLSDGHE